MNRRSTGTVNPDILNFTIREDELEHHRIQLEHNLQNTEISFHLSSSAGSDHEENLRQIPPKPRQRQAPQRIQKKKQTTSTHVHYADSSVELPRHLSEPSIQDIPSFVHRSRDHFTGEDMHHWSYRPDDDEEGISPYGNTSLSTVNHHASAVTLNAGLGGGRTRRERSLSGAEYDPDRPLHAMIAGVNSKHSMFDLDPKSKSNLAHSMTADPIVVDSTAELDRILETGHARPLTSPSRNRSLQNTSPISSGPSSSSDSSDHHNHVHNPSTQPISPSRPKLSDHLRHVSFSPKRPRTAQVQAPGSTSPLTRAQQLLDDNNATPRPKRMPSYNTPAPKPAVRLHPATPSSGGGGTTKFTRVARTSLNNKGTNGPAETGSLARNSQPHRRVADPESNPFGDLSYVDVPQAPPARMPPPRHVTPRKSSLKDSNHSRVFLPDVTGLTAAVESPAKPGVAYYSIKAEHKARESEARLLQTLQSVQNQLQDLEDENGISRRRVRELELELEECKREVARERTRLLEREHDSSFRQTKGVKGKGKARAGVGAGLGVIDDERMNERYKDVVEEKRALEALINSLRTHLTRLTAELASHQELLSELRRLRDTDSKALQEKGAEILRLSEEVQRLAGEVEVLRGVVEEGLKERRASREGEMVSVDLDQSPADRSMSMDLEGEDTEQDEDNEAQGDDEPDASEEEDEGTADEHDEEEEELTAQRRQRNPWGNPDISINHFAPTHGTFGSNDGPAAHKRMVDDVEMSRIVAEVEERRSNRSNASIRLSPSPPPQTRAQQQQRQRKPRTASTRVQVGNDTIAHYGDETEEEAEAEEQANQGDRIPLFSPSRNNREGGFVASSPPLGFTQNLNLNSRPSAPTPRHAAHYLYPHTRKRSTGNTAAPAAPPTTSNDHHEEEEAHVVPEDSPFPQIRGERLERLFFSAPEHNAQTCTVCYRRRQNSSSPDVGAGPSRPQAGVPSRAGSQDDNGAEPVRVYLSYSSDPAHYQRIGKQYGLPAQTVVARVIRELEDDFTHYKSIYVELADQYKMMDAASDVLRRNTLAKHLKEVVDVLEQKGDQIASLYDLLSFKDKQALAANS